jgi:hypothetical protein
VISPMPHPPKDRLADTSFPLPTMWLSDSMIPDGEEKYIQIGWKYGRTGRGN